MPLPSLSSLFTRRSVSGARPCVSVLRLSSLLLVLVLLCALSLQPSCASNSLLLHPPRTDLMLFTSFVQDSFVQRAVLLYTLSRSTEEVRIRTAYKAATATANSVSNGFTAMKNAEADFAVLPAVATAAIVRHHPRVCASRGLRDGQFHACLLLHRVLCRVWSACDRA